MTSTTDQSTLREEFASSGRVWLRGAMNRGEVANLATLVDQSNRVGERFAPSSPLGCAIANGGWIGEIRAAWPDARPVRVVTFAKRDGADWTVPWHQDRVIAVAERRDVPGFHNWSQKAGIWHCEPPEAVLSDMLFVRLHIDRNDTSNGAMEIALGSHRAGLVPARHAEQIASAYQQEDCTAEPGDVLLLSMLTLHRSGANSSNEPRRAVRVDFATLDLPTPLSWAS